MSVEPATICCQRYYPIVLQSLLSTIFSLTPPDPGNACVGPSRNIRMAMQNAAFPEEYIDALKGIRLCFLVEMYMDYDNGYLSFIIMIPFFPLNPVPQLILFFTIHLVASYRYRSNHGTPDYECQHCHALFWYSERTSITRSTGIVQYNNCCKGGKICLPSYQPRPQPLASITRFDGDLASRKFIR
jgi:hypothetical protein